MQLEWDPCLRYMFFDYVCHPSSPACFLLQTLRLEILPALDLQPRRRGLSASSRATCPIFLAWCAAQKNVTKTQKMKPLF